MGNCISTQRPPKKRREEPPSNPSMFNSREEEGKNMPGIRSRPEDRLTNEQLSVLSVINLEKKERQKQEYNLKRLRETLNNDMESFLLNNLLFSVQFFENFHRDRSTFRSQRLRQQSRMNAEGPGGGLSSSRHKKRASLPDTMQEIVGRWVRLDPPILNSPTFPTKSNAKTARSKSYTSLSNSTEKLSLCKELLAPLRVMVVHEDVRIVDKEGEEDLYRAIIPEPIPKMAGYLKLRCVGHWPEEIRNDEIYEKNSRDKDGVHKLAIYEDTEYPHSSEYNGSQRARDDESEYSYLEKKLYDKTLKSKEYLSEVVSTASSSSSEEDHDGDNQTMSPGEKLLADRKKRGAASNISQRPPMKPPQDSALNLLPQESNPEPPYVDDLKPAQLAMRGRRDSGTGQNLPAWPFKPPSNSRVTGSYYRNGETPQNTMASKESDNWKLGKSATYGNTPKRFNSPKLSLSTENSDSDYGYATIPTSHTSEPTAKRHGGIPHQCLTKVRYRHINDEDDEECDREGEELARQLEEQGGDLRELFITKTFLNPCKFLNAFEEEVLWRDYGYSSTNGGSQRGNSASLNPAWEQRSQINQRQGRNSKASVDSGNGDEDDSLQACLGIPASVPVNVGDASWFSQRDSHGMRFPIEIIPSIAIPWLREDIVTWLLGRKRNKAIIDERTKEKRPAWPGKLVYEASRTECHVVVPPNLQNKNLELPKTHQKSEQNNPPHLAWKICFCEAERLIEEGLSHAQTRCLLYVLLLRRCYLQWDKFGLSQNFVRTAFYWQCEKGKINWPEEEMGNNLRTVLAKIYRSLTKRKLADFFIKNKNIAEEESQVAIPKAQNVLHSMDEALSIHVARAISGLRFSDSRVPILDFKRLVHILTDEHALIILNPELYGISMATGGITEDEEDEYHKNDEYNKSTKDLTRDSGESPSTSFSLLNQPNFQKSKIIPQQPHRETPTHTFRENEVEFHRIGTKYIVNDVTDRDVTETETNVIENQSSSQQKPIKIKVIKGAGTLTTKKQQQHPPVSDAFSRLKKPDNDKEWIAQYRKQFAEKKKKDDKREELEDDDIFAKAESYKPVEIQSNYVKKQLLLSLFANHFEQLGRRCGRDWGAIKVADSYLRHAENLAILLAEYEGDTSPYDDDEDDDDDRNKAAAKNILNRVKKEFKYLANLKGKKQEKKPSMPDSRRNTVKATTSNHSEIAKSMPNLNSISNQEKIKNKASIGSTRSINNIEDNSDEELSSENEKL